MAFSDCNHYIKTPMVYKSSEVSRSEVKGFKVIGIDRMCDGIVRITLKQKKTMQHGVVAFIEVGSQENYFWAPPVLLLNFLFFLIFPSSLAGSEGTSVFELV